MTLSVKGFQGTVSDTDMATQLGAHHIATVRSLTDLLVTAVAGARTVAVAAGTADSGFIKVTNDGNANGNLVLAPPNSGGRWYAITIDRQWSPSSGAVLRADDLSIFDANGTIPTVLPSAVISSMANLPDQPGTAGSTAGQRQFLAAVYVRAVDTTLTIFDLRAVRSGAGTISFSSLHALAALAYKFVDGAIVAVRETSLDGTVRLYQSAWQKVQGVFRPASGSPLIIDNAGSIAQYIAGLTYLFTNIQQPYGAYLSWPNGQRARDSAGFEYGWGRKGATWTLEPGPLTRASFRMVGNPGGWPDNTNQALPWDTVEYDPMGMWRAGGSDTRRILYPVAGRYRLTFSFAPNGGDVANVSGSFPVYAEDGATYLGRRPADFKGYVKGDNAVYTTQEVAISRGGITGYCWAYRNDGNASRGFSYGSDDLRPTVTIDYLGPLGS